ncbi:MAG: T9SS type A sorting domain-containing protein [Hymenobacter sp.]|nr:MAG: T9SS type A sorting domain-containing protein [Hymenobacter sp.]
MKKIVSIWVAGMLLLAQAWGQSGLPSLSLAGIPVIKSHQLASLQLPPLPHFGPSPQGNAIARTTDVCQTSCAIILPLTALELSGTRVNDYQASLNWTTRHETGSKGFDIERSFGDATHFSIVGSAPTGTGTAVEKKYAHTDANNYAGNSFYRIKQIDINGNFAYSNTLLVRGYNTKESIWLSPNPASAATTLSCYVANRSTATVKILSTLGQVLYEKPYPLNAGSNQFTLPLSAFAKGMYYVQLIWADGHHSSSKLEVK